MHAATPATLPAATLADLLPLPASRARTIALVVGAAALTAACAQISLPVPGTPVPMTLQTAAVLLAGAGLGWRAGALSQLLYVAAGVAGAPIYADGVGGWAAATGPTAGYLVGFVLAAALVGRLAERGQDRSVLTSVPAMLAGSAVIYACGVTWLARSLGLSSQDAIAAGLAPFVVGDVVKLVAAGLLLPAVWSGSARGA